MITEFQDELFGEAETIAQRFAKWKATPGGAQVMCRAYRITAGYYERFKVSGRGVSQRLIWETLRDRIDGIRRELRVRKITLVRERGFYLNDHFTAHLVRHMIAEHPEWEPMFELREIGKCRGKLVKRVTVETFGTTNKH